MIRTHIIQATAGRALWLGIGFILSFSRHTAGGGAGATIPSDAAPDYDIEAPRFDHHGRTWASWTHTAFMRQAVACATAVATFGGATYAAKCEMRDLHSAASHHQVGELAEDAEPLEPMPEPMCAA